MLPFKRRKLFGTTFTHFVPRYKYGPSRL